VFHQFSVFDAKCIERERLVKLARRSGIVAVVPVDDGDDVALGRNDLKRVAWWRRPQTEAAYGSGCLSKKRVFELFLVADVVFCGALYKHWVVLLVGDIGERHAICP
jgi:hypothetical protein